MLRMNPAPIPEVTSDPPSDVDFAAIVAWIKVAANPTAAEEFILRAEKALNETKRQAQHAEANRNRAEEALVKASQAASENLARVGRERAELEQKIADATARILANEESMARRELAVTDALKAIEQRGCEADQREAQANKREQELAAQAAALQNAQRQHDEHKQATSEHFDECHACLEAEKARVEALRVDYEGRINLIRSLSA